mgnify:CR=1 FL=1
MSAAATSPVSAARPAPPTSDVSAGVGLAGLAGLVAWIAFCRSYPEIAAMIRLGGPLSPERGVLFLVTHAPGRLLATIRSRCRRLSFPIWTPDRLAA